MVLHVFAKTVAMDTYGSQLAGEYEEILNGIQYYWIAQTDGAVFPYRPWKAADPWC